VRAFTNVGLWTVISEYGAHFLLQPEQSPAGHPQLTGAAATGFNPFIYGNDVDSVDIATRVAMVSTLFHHANFWLLGVLVGCLIVRLCLCASTPCCDIGVLHLKNPDKFNCGSCSYNIIHILRGDEELLCPHFVVFNWMLPIIPIFVWKQCFKNGFVSPKPTGRKVAFPRVPLKYDFLLVLST